MMKLNDQIDQIEELESEITISLKEYRRLLKAELETSRLKNELRSMSEEMRRVKAERLEWEKSAREMEDKFEYIQAMGRILSRMQDKERMRSGNEQDIDQHEGHAPGGMAEVPPNGIGRE